MLGTWGGALVPGGQEVGPDPVCRSFALALNPDPRGGAFNRAAPVKHKRRCRSLQTQHTRCVRYTNLAASGEAWGGW